MSSGSNIVCILTGRLFADGNRNGAFTKALGKVWYGGKFKGGHAKFRREISDTLSPTQSPNYFTVGIKDMQFESIKLFTKG